jgi:hypothetical protein
MEPANAIVASSCKQRSRYLNRTHLGVQDVLFRCVVCLLPRILQLEAHVKQGTGLYFIPTLQYTIGEP